MVNKCKSDSPGGHPWVSVGVGGGVCVVIFVSNPTTVLRLCCVGVGVVTKLFSLSEPTSACWLFNICLAKILLLFDVIYRLLNVEIQNNKERLFFNLNIYFTHGAKVLKSWIVNLLNNDRLKLFKTIKFYILRNFNQGICS